MLADEQLRGEYFDGYRVRVREGGYSLHFGNADSDEKRSGHTPPPGGGGRTLVFSAPSPLC